MLGGAWGAETEVYQTVRNWKVVQATGDVIHQTGEWIGSKAAKSQAWADDFADNPSLETWDTKNAARHVGFKALETLGEGVEYAKAYTRRGLRAVGVPADVAQNIVGTADTLLMLTGGTAAVKASAKAVGRGVQKVTVRTGGASAAEGAGAASSLDHVIKGPYNSRTMEQILAANNPSADVTAHTMARRGDPNARLAGSHHPETAVPFDHRGFPIFEQHVVFETRLGPSFIAKSSESHMREATRHLREAIERGQISRSKFTDRQISEIFGGRSRIHGYTWHHHAESGRMQMVPNNVHKHTAHAGGASKWKTE